MTAPLPWWVHEVGSRPELVISSRVRLARNLADLPFASRNSAAQREQVVDRVADASRAVPELQGATWHRMEGLSAAARLWLLERQMISRELAGMGPGPGVVRGAAALADGRVSVLCNEEDHLRIQAIAPGFGLGPAHRAVDRLETELGARISFAFDPGFGYLTSCPTNVGTGLRASVLIHLPALVFTREIGKVLHGLAGVGLTHRGLRGEGSEVVGHLFQLSNQVTLGRSEAELLEHLGRLLETVMRHEMAAREVLLRDAPERIADRVWRAWGVLRYARMLGYVELLNLLSDVRLGVTMGILPSVAWRQQNRLLVEAQDAHLARREDTGLDDEALPVHRATLVRRLFDEERGG